MANILLQVNGLTIASPEQACLVDDVSFVLHEGEILGLVGESGSGKTLTCRSLMQLLPKGVLEVRAGEVLYAGQDVLNMTETQLRQLRGRGIGMIFQNPSAHLNPLMTIGQHMIESLRLYERLSAKAARAKAEAILAQVGIPSPRQRLNAYAHEFSGGMRQRAMIAISLAASPKILIADEPTTALDVTVQAQILKLLDQLRREYGLAIILITHDLGVVAQTCDRVAVMYGGRICEVAMAGDLLRHPKHPYTRGLIECQPLTGESGLRVLNTIPGQPPTAKTMAMGCRFHPRCHKATDLCRAKPPVREVFNEREISCYFPDTENPGEVCYDR
ncbi:ABC transporter ATP-binding protein [Gynuella sp.]|uniref:ABC transporter ATP-binding protein n=1 Tax=Gynuella sp. TaxID=2969146 RepID=UPI003D0E99AF